MNLISTNRMALLTEPSTNDQWNGCPCETPLRKDKCMMGLEIPQNRGAPSSISVFGLTQESEIGKGFGQSGF